ncbi:SLBB domain-containing protein [Shewanella fidelis]|uniref:SLBB domain-containing protein n=1 Tax=Shewanella fidelis TaxID=173509 RepID=A0AAW8NPH6_9GAMM|nr:SLBB domain-containing protein [Shewanella fidelis]MDR8524436.1 SLBB domain-containing protein [Shewanella fidelis]MDW4811912.1 SLBB domain-containing protein [Shewanella fidelis]MDW4817149.1 SLBB domain-containing protein [Shewanella fidelis]MDW4821219.1 SLBB domain-containing protein [Shewanella fidelis]MDW4822518.1 SLBB domain-containing protein [Shewanella fidelis]
MLNKTKKLIIAGMSALILLSGQAYAITPSPQMIEQFKNLPASEQQRLAKQYGIDPSMLGGSSAQAPIENPQVVQQRGDAEQLKGSKVIDQSADAKNELDFEQDSNKNELKRFGYDLFQGEPTTFAPVSDVPVPSEYLVGPGDNIKVQLYGKDNKEYDLVINREGVIQFPELGPISVAGLTFSEVRDTLSSRITQQMIGIESNITMGELRSIRIFVAGDAYKPGSYTVSSLSTITQALFVAGGVNEIGSLRNIQVKRKGKLVGSMDLYDLLLRGDASGDINLRSGDVVFIPSVGGLVSVTGEVRRPAIYELKQNETMAQVIEMAAGIKPGAYPRQSSVERFNDNSLKSILNVDLTTKAGKATKALAGDVIQVKSATTQYEDAITVVGAAVRPGKYQWYQGQKISDLVPSIWGDLNVSVDLEYAIVVREINKQGDIQVYQFSPVKAINGKDPSQNLTLQARDKVIFFNFSDLAQNRYELNKLVKQRVEKVQSLSGDSLIGNDLFQAGFSQLSQQKFAERTELGGIAINSKVQDTDPIAKAIKGEVNKMLINLFEDRALIELSGVMNRGELLYPIIMKLNSQGRAGAGVKAVAINGRVNNPGIYPLTVNARIKDLVIAAGGLEEGAYTTRAELTSTYTTVDGSAIKHTNIGLEAALNGDETQNIIIKGRDILTVMTTPDWQENKSVEIRGEVKFPGTYNIRRGETLADVLQRAGGFTEYAYLPSSVFVRESVRQQEQLEIKKLADQLRRDIATRGVSKDGNVVNYSDAQMMLTDLETIKAVGRLVVDLSAISVGIKQADLQLEDKDVLYIPSTKQTIAVMGEVQHAATHRFKEGQTVEQYLAMSGGVRERADDDRTYVIKADGSVMVPSRSMWFSSETSLQPGDTIIVPLDTEYKDNLTLWTQVTSIIYNTAVAFATVANL